jgi:thioesterase domain-containing protein
MRFPGTGASMSTGWSSFSADGDAERFQDEGRGTAQLVCIDEVGVPPRIETIEVGRLRWAVEHRDVTSRPLGEIISEFGTERTNQELTILRLTLSGVMDPAQHGRIDSVLREIVCNRYSPGSSLDAHGVLVEPDADQLRQIVGAGVLSRVLSRLKQEAQSSDTAAKDIAHHALKLLYRIAWEGQPK